MKRPRSLLEEIAGLDDPTPRRDFDPEDIGFDQEFSDASDQDPDAPQHNPRSHYEAVGESKLRRKEPATLGPQYRGSRITRTAVDDGEEDDPFLRDYDGSDSDDEEDVDSVRKNGRMSVGDHSGESQGDDDTGDEQDAEEDGQEEESEDGFEDEASDAGRDDDDDDDEDFNRHSSSAHGKSDSKPKIPATTVDRSELRKLMVQDQKSVALNLSQAIKGDVEKGLAVKKQRTVFDNLLNVRIKMQKALIAANTIPLVDLTEKHEESMADAITAAERAAFRLWNNVTSLRASLDKSEPAAKRTRFQPAEEDTPLKSMWTAINTSEKAAIARRNTTLDLWSAKCRPANLANTRGRLNAQAQQNLSEVLAGQLANKERLVAKTRVPRSCAPIQAASTPGATSAEDVDTERNGGTGNNHQLPIFDDSDFYTTLLQNLISQRSSNAASTMTFDASVAELPKHVKQKRVNLDTRASKGRKLSYAVHEKLQNFLAPEDRTTWGDAQCDELFGNLFGMGVKKGLDEGVHGDDADEDGGDDAGDEGVEGLRLFSAAVGD